MAQPPRYNRTKDFAEDYGDNTDHPALNAELDAVSSSVNAIRANLALVQRDDGGLANGIVTEESLAPGLQDQIIASVGVGIDDKVQEAQAAASEAVNAASLADTYAQASLNSANAAAQSASNAAGSATSADNSRISAQNSAAAALQSKNDALASAQAAGVSEANALQSENNAAGSAQAALASEQAAAISEGNASTSEQNAANSAGAASLSAGNAATSESNAASSANAAALSEGNAAASEAAAQSYVESLTQPFFFVKNYDGLAIKKTGAGTAVIQAGTTVIVNLVAKTFAVDTPIIMPTLTPGADYSVWVLEDGTAQAVADPFSAPAAAPAANAVKIGGFHYGLIASGTTPASGSFSTAGITSGGGSFGWTQSDVDKLAGINEFSIWDLTFRCAGEQRGMTFDPIKQMWAGIYLMSDSPHIHGPSAYNTNVASGTVLPYIPAKWGGNGVLKYSRLSAFEAHELVSAFGLRLPTYEEFMGFAFGVTEAQSLGGAASTIPATARQPGYTSRIGVEQATGHQWVIGGPIKSVGGSAWADIGRGSWYGSSGLVLLGGIRGHAAISGSRCAIFFNALSDSYWSISVRAAGDHLNLGRAAR
ncbi:hypothetical protein [Pusillimonas minor]|uniref:Major tropism determinant second domain-containing protein n=1 Tax=Pusillimonas minor TaxID=2697024 RepID=A0A842HNS8_9BURK|nr:hypothetical protein [Pusillimonas minor]MBC2768565.1 hypothetical protein [Pusillimonas minor]